MYQKGFELMIKRDTEELENLQILLPIRFLFTVRYQWCLFTRSL